MALGSGGNLGTLTLFINANTADFDQAVNRVEQKARAFGSRFGQLERGLNLVPDVDDSQLTALNKHLALKEQHFLQVNRVFQQSPLSPSVQTGNLEDLRWQLQEVINLQKQAMAASQGGMGIGLPRMKFDIAPRFDNRVRNEAPRINANLSADPRLNVSPRIQIAAAGKTSDETEKVIRDLNKVEATADKINKIVIQPSLDVEQVEKFTKRIAVLETQLEVLKKETDRSASKKSWDGVGKAIGTAAAESIPVVSRSVGEGLAVGISNAIPAFTGKLGEAVSTSIVQGALKAAIPRISFSTSFTDVVRAGKELAGVAEEIKADRKNGKDSGEKRGSGGGILGFAGRILGSALTGVVSGIGGRISTGIVAGLEDKLEIKFRDAAQEAVVVLSDGIEEAFGFQFNQVGKYVQNIRTQETSVEQALLHLSNEDDGAVGRDGVGFNKRDTKLGNTLAEKVLSPPGLSADERQAALTMLQKYRKQLLNAGLRLPALPAIAEQKRTQGTNVVLPFERKSGTVNGVPDPWEEPDSQKSTQSFNFLEEAGFKFQDVLRQAQQPDSRKEEQSLNPVAKFLSQIQELFKGLTSELDLGGGAIQNTLKTFLDAVASKFSDFADLLSALGSFGGTFADQQVEGFTGKKTGEHIRQVQRSVKESPVYKTYENLGIDEIVQEVKTSGLDLEIAREQLKQQKEKLSQAALSVPGEAVGEVLSSRREENLRRLALPLVEERAKAIGQQKRTKNSGRVVDEDTEELFIAVGGYGGARGLSGAKNAQDLAKVLPENKKVIWVKNEESDIASEDRDDPQRKLKALVKSLAIPHVQGYSKDAVEMASQAVAALEKNPTVKVKLVGISGGGFIAEEAWKILEMMGHGDRVDYRGLGTPDLVGRLDKNQERKIISPDESLGAETHRFFAPLGLARTGGNQNILGAIEHSYEGYVDRGLGEVDNYIKGVPEAQFDRDDINLAKGALPKFQQRAKEAQFTFQFEEIEKQSFAAVQMLRRQIEIATDDTKEELEGLAEGFQQVYIRVSNSTVDKNRIVGTIKDAEETFKKIEQYPKEKAQQTQQRVVKDLKKLKLEVLKKINTTAGTEKQQFQMYAQDIDNVLAQGGQVGGGNKGVVSNVIGLATGGVENLQQVISQSAAKFTESGVDTFRAIGVFGAQLDIVRETIEQNSGGFVQSAEQLAATIKQLEANFRSILPQQPEAGTTTEATPVEQTKTYQALFKGAAKVSHVNFNSAQVPKLVVDDKRLKQAGAKALYSAKNNEIVITSAIKQLLEKSPEELSQFAGQYADEVKDLIHEIRHAFQFKFGEISYADLAEGATPGALTKFSKTSSRAQAYGTKAAESDYYKQHAATMPAGYLDIVKKTEADATNFEDKWQEVIQQAVASQIDSAKFAVNPDDFKSGIDLILDTLIENTIQSVTKSIDEFNANLQSQASSVNQQGAGQAIGYLDELAANLDVQVENIEKFLDQVEAQNLRNSPFKQNPAIQAVRENLRNQVAGVHQNIGGARTNAVQTAGTQATVAPPPTQTLTAWEKVRKVISNVREEIKAIGSGQTLAGRAIQGAALDLGISIPDDVAEQLAKQKGIEEQILKAASVGQSALKKDWKGVLEELLGEINGFADAALDRFADFVQGIPGGGVFAKVIRGAKEFKGVVIGFAGLQVAWQGLVQVKQWLDSFDEVFVDAAIEWEKFERILSFSSKTFGQTQENIKMVRDEATRLRTDLKQSMRGFSQLSAASMETGLEGGGTRQIFKGINQASSAYGLDSEGQGRVYTAISQMISKGTVSAEELRQQLGEILPGSFQAAARAAGKTTQEFSQLLETGQILAEDFLPKFASQLSAETAVGVAGAANSAQGATNRLNNSLFEMQAALGNFGIDERNLFLNKMAEGMDIVQKNAVLASYAMGSLLLGAILTLKDAFIIFTKALATAASKFVMTRLGITTLGLSMKTLWATMATAAKSFAWITLIMEGYAMISTAMKDSSGKSREFADSMKGAFKETQRSIAEARGELEQFNAAQAKLDGKKGTGKTVRQGQDSIIDEAPMLNWILKKDVQDNSGWFDKLRFGARQGLARATDSMGTFLNPGAALESVRTGDRTLAPTYANKKFQETKRSTTEILDISSKSAEGSVAALNDEELKKVKEYDEELRQIQIKRRGITQINPGDKEGLNELKRREEEILALREKSYKPLAAMQSTNQVSIQALEAEIEVYKEKISASEAALATADSGKDKKDIQARLDYYKQTLPQLQDGLKKVQTAQDNLSKSIGESVDKFILLQKQLQNVADRLADANDSIQKIANEGKSELSQAAARGDITSGQAEVGKRNIDEDVLDEQLKRRKAAINEYQGLLYGNDAQAILESRGIKNINDVGQAQLTTLSSKAKEGTPEKEVFNRLSEMKKLELEASDLQAQLDASREQATQQIRDANKQINDYFRDIGRQSAELALTTKEAQAQIALQQQKNKLKSALQGFQDNFFSSFVDSIIEGMDSLNEPLNAQLEREREFQSAQFAREDRDRQGAELYKSLPLDTQNIKLDFSAIDSAPVKELQASLEQSAKASKNVTDATKEAGAAIGDSANQANTLQSNVAGVSGKAKDATTAIQGGKGAIADSANEANNLKGNVADVGAEADNVRAATDSVTTALQGNISEVQNVNTELTNNQASIQGNQTAVEGVNDAVGVQAQKVAEATAATEETKEATSAVRLAWSLVTGGVGETIVKTFELFKGLANNIPFLNQFSGIFGSWEGFIQKLIAKTWEFFKGLADNIPFLNQIGETIGGWGSQVGQAVGGAIQDAGNAWNQGVGAASGMLGRGEGVGNVGKYKIVESVGGSIQNVNSYRDLEKHHPSSGREPGRNYGTVDGEFEEIRNTGDGRTLVKKDFVLMDSKGSQAANIPAMAAGFVRVLNDATNTVQLFADKEMTKLIGQSLHQRSVAVKTGDYVRYGQSLGVQGDTGSPGAIHAHIEMEVGRFKQYVQDLLDGTFEGTKGKTQEHHLGDGHNHFGEDDAKKGNQVTGRATGALGKSMWAMQAQLDKQVSATPTFSKSKATNPDQFVGAVLSILEAPTRQGRVDVAQVISNRVGTNFGNYGNSVRDQAFASGQFQPFFKETYGIGKGDIRDMGSAVGALRKAGYSASQAQEALNNFFSDISDPSKVADSQSKVGGRAYFKGTTQQQYMRGDDFLRNKNENFFHHEDGDTKNRKVTPISAVFNGAKVTLASASSPSAPAQAAPAAPRPIIQPVPFASMQKQMSVSGTTVDASKLSIAEQKSAQMQRDQEAAALKKEQERINATRIEGEQRQIQRIERNRQNILETQKSRVQLGRQFRDMGLDIGEQTPEREAARKKMGINDSYDDQEKEIAEDIRRYTAARDQAKGLVQQFTSPEYRVQPGQDVQKDIAGANAAIAAAEQYLADLTKIQGEIKGQREARIKFQEDLDARERKAREQQQRFATEEVSISKLEAEVQRLEDMKGRGIRDQGVENLPKIQATIAARREELGLQQKISEIDENIKKNPDNPVIVGELNKQKAGLQDRLKIVKQTIDENRKYAEEVARRDREKRQRDAAASLETAKLSVIESRIASLRELEKRNPYAEEVKAIPALEKLLAARKNIAEADQKIREIDQLQFENQRTPQEAEAEKAEVRNKLAIDQKTVEENALYAAQLMTRNSDRRSREASTEIAKGELSVLKQQLESMQQIASLNPLAPEAAGIAALQQQIELKEAELALTEQIAAIEEKRFTNDMSDEEANQRIADLKKENETLVKNINVRAARAQKEQEFARMRTELELKEQDASLKGNIAEALAKNIEFGRNEGDPIEMRFEQQRIQQNLGLEKTLLELDELEASGKRSKEEVDKLRESYRLLNEISLDNLILEQQRAVEDKAMEISGRFNQSRGAVLGGRADLLGSLGLDTQAKEFRKVAAIADQKQNYSQQSLELERFIAQMGLGAERALELRTNLSEVNNMKLDQINAEFSTMNELMVGVQGSFESAFTSILDGSKSIGEAALDFLKGVGSQLASMASKLITDELFGKIMGKGNKDDAEKEAGLIGKGGVLGALRGGENPLAAYSLANPLPVMLTNTSALGGGLSSISSGLGGFSEGGTSFVDSLLGTGSIFGGAKLGQPLPVDIKSANESIFSSLTNGIMGIFGGSGGTGGGLGGLIGGALSLFGGGGNSGLGGGLGFLSAIPNIFGIFAEGGEVGHPKFHAQLAQGLKKESALTGRRSRLIIASDGELIVPHKIVAKLSGQEKAILTGRQMPPSASIPAYANGGIVGNSMGAAISSNVTNLGGNTSIGGSTVNVNGDGGGSMTPAEAKAMQAMIDQRVMEVVSKAKRPRGLLYR